jgi:hypothetical protein
LVVNPFLSSRRDFILGVEAAGSAGGVSFGFGDFSQAMLKMVASRAIISGAAFIGASTYDGPGSSKRLAQGGR